MNDTGEAAPELAKAQTRRASLFVAASFRPLLWGLANRMPVFCDHIFGRLGKFGVGPNEMRVDNGDGTVGGYNLNFWALDYQIRCTMRLPRAEVDCHAMENVDVETLDEVIQAVLEAVEATDENVVVENYEVSFQIHARTTDTTPRELLQQFVKYEPKGMGPCIANSVSFTFGTNGKRNSSSIAADLSREFFDSIFIDGRVDFDGTKIHRSDLKSEAADYVTESLTALGLTLQATGSTQ